MDRRRFLALSVAALCPSPLSAFSVAEMACRLPEPPLTARHRERIVQLGRVRIDEYAWLKDAHWKEVWQKPSSLDPAIAAHLQRENAYSRAVLAPTETLQKTLFAEMSAFPGEDAQSPPQPDGEWLYFSRMNAGAQHPAYYRRARDGRGAEVLLLDVEARATGVVYLHVAEVLHSFDGNWLAWSEDEHGAERFQIYLKDLRTGEILPEPIHDAFGSFVFSPDSQWLFWILRDENSRPSRVYRRAVRSSADTLVYEEHDPGLLMTLARTAANTFVMIRCWNAETSEVRLIPANAPTATPVVAEPRTAGLVYSVEDWKGQFVVLTNADGAVDFKLMLAPRSDPSRRNWREWIPHRSGHYVLAMLPFRDYFVRVERVDANARILVTRASDMAEGSIAFTEAAYSASLLPEQEYGAATLYYSYESPRQPRQWFAYDMVQKSSTLLRAERGSVSFRSENYIVERLFATADDGAQVPITLLRGRDGQLDGKAPLLLYGYGSYGAFVEPEFSSPVLSLVDRGWSYAIAHVRGGSAKGWSWFLEARRLHKKRTFEDFIACAECLIESRHTGKGRIVIHGFSAGGLLVGAANNMRPALWAGVIGQAPFVDMLNTVSDASHPLVPLTWPDWGNPLKESNSYDYIASYSPYENVRPQRYPPVLATTNVADDRVGYWEPAKWIAKLRQCDVAGSPMLLQTQFEGGHGGNADRDAMLRQSALFYAFAIWAAARKCEKLE